MEDIICTGCDFAIGNHIRLYDYILSEIKKQKKEKKDANRIKIEFLLVDTNFTFQVGTLLDALHITNECCRKTLLSKVRVKDLS
jgi:DNA-directed RNA polymerase subunit N (RpoN/RPB10)